MGIASSSAVSLMTLVSLSFLAEGCDRGTNELYPVSGTLGPQAAPDAGAGPVFGEPVKANGVRFGGVSLAGAEFGPAKLPGKHGVDYTFPAPSSIDYYTSKGMNLIRLPILWERLQTTPLAPLDEEYLGLIDDVVAHTTRRGAQVLLDVHSFGRYQGKKVGEEIGADVFADFWSKVAAHYANAGVVFGLMTSPHDQSRAAWNGAANAAIAAIRNAGAKNLVTVPGTDFSSASTWVSGGNAAEMAVVDPANNWIFEVHQYLDADGSGTRGECVSATVGSERVTALTTWARQNGKRAFLGELAGGRNDVCYAALDDLLGYLDANSDVWAGWAYWAGGAWWVDGYPFRLDPKGAEQPQMAILEKHLRGLSPGLTPTK
jgi:endoglucanase